MSEYSKEHWDALVSIYENNGRTRVSAHEIGIIWADQHIKDLTKQLQEAKASSVPVDDIAQLIHDVLNQEFVSQHPSDVMGRELLRQALNAFPAPSEHRWDQAGERCVKCGAKDWMGGPCVDS